MHLNSPKNLGAILQNSHFTIIITEVELPKSCTTFSATIPIPLNDKNTYDVETVRNIETLTRTKHPTPTTIYLASAHLLTLAAQNAFLKLLEEPAQNISFLFVAPNVSAFLPTILSRAKVFHLAPSTHPTPPPDDTTLSQARTLVAGNPRDLIPLATTLAKSRDRALEVTRTAIQMLYESQLKHPTPGFLARLEKLLSLEKALSSNGHVKLHIINMISNDA